MRAWDIKGDILNIGVSLVLYPYVDVTLEELIVAYETNSIRAQIDYRDSYITGAIREIGYNYNDQPYLEFAMGYLGFNTRCFFPESELDKLIEKRVGDVVKVYATLLEATSYSAEYYCYFTKDERMKDIAELELVN